MNVGKAETEGSAKDGTDRHGVTHNGHGTLQPTFSQAVNHWPGPILQRLQRLSPWWGCLRRVLTPAFKIGPMIAEKLDPRESLQFSLIPLPQLFSGFHRKAMRCSDEDRKSTR